VLTLSRTTTRFGHIAVHIKEALIDNILRPLVQLEEYAETPDSDRSLAAHCRWADRLEDEFARVEDLIEEGVNFSRPKTWRG
jgi:hypothetical protein